MKKYNDYIKESYDSNKYPLTCKLIKDLSSVWKKDDLCYIRSIDFDNSEAVICKIGTGIDEYNRVNVYLDEIQIIPDIFIYSKYNL